MKKFLFVMTIMIIISFSSSCSSKVQADYNKSNSTSQNVLDDVDPNCIHNIDELEAQIYVPEGFIIFTRDLPEEEYEKYGFTKKAFVESMILQNFFFEAVSVDSQSELAITIKEDDFTNGIINLKNASEEIVQAMGSGFATGFGDYKVFETPQLKYLVFEYKMDHIISNTTSNNFKFMTIANGKNVTLLFRKSGEELTEEERNMVRFCAESITFEQLIE